MPDFKKALEELKEELKEFISNEIMSKDFIAAWLILSTIIIIIRINLLEHINTTGTVVHKYTCLKEPFKMYRVAVDIPSYKIITRKVTKDKFKDIDIGDKIEIETLIYRR